MKKLIEYLINNFDKVKIHSNYIDKGDVFIALAGKNNHGNNFIQVAIRKGAKYIITDQKPDLNSQNKKIIIVKNSLKFLKEISIKKRKLYNGKVIGITGSIGKTSIKENLKFFLTPYFVISASIKSYNNYLGVIISLINLNLKSHFAIFEIGTNDFFEIRKLTSLVKPSQVIISNIYQTHLEKLINTRNIAIEKSDIFNPKYNSLTKLLIIPNEKLDEKFIINKAKKSNIENIISIGKSSNSDLKILSLKNKKYLSINVKVKYNDEIINFNINKSQIHRINNIICCLAIFIYNEINLSHFTSLTNEIPEIEGRGKINQININKKKINLIDESYNASPQSMKTCITYFKDIRTRKEQKKLLILGDMKELGNNSLNYHIEILEYLITKKLSNVIICGELFKIALDKICNKNILSMNDINSIIEFAKNNLNDNDIVLIKGSNSSITRKLALKLLENRRL